MHRKPVTKAIERGRFSRTVPLAALLLALLALLLPVQARATPSMGADAYSTFGFVFGSCTGTSSNLVPSNLPQSSTFICGDIFGDTLEADARASFGSVGALATVTAIPCPSSDDCAANAIANASYSGDFTFFAPSDITFVTGNMSISGGSSATFNAAGNFLGTETVNGQITVQCIDIGGNGPDPGPFCTSTPVAVVANVPVTVSITLEAGAGANAGFGSQTEVGTANAFDTFAFPIGSDVFTVDPGVTVNSLDSFVVNNRYLPPKATATAPEPASILLLFGGLIALGALRRLTHAAPSTHVARSFVAPHPT
jgi:hypothetical protein